MDMKHLTPFWTVAIVLLVAATPAIAGTVYYVNGANGHDSNPGIATVPWKTIQKAANNMVAGDGVVVAAGSYPERVVISRSGTVGSEISYTASGLVECRGFTVRGDYILVKGFKVTAPQATYADQGYGIWVEGKACRVEDNYAYYSPRGGINLRPNSSACVVRNNRCHRNGMEGMEIHGTGNLIENNDIWGSISYHTPTGAVGDADGIRFFGTGHVFRGNYIHDISYQDPENVGYAPHIDGFQTWEDTYHAAASNIVLERNRIVLPVYKDGAAKGHAFMLHNCGYLMIRNNLVIAHNGTNTDGAATGGATHHLTIVGNTLAGSLAFLRSNHPAGISLENCPNSVVRNNIIYDQPDTAIYLAGSTLTGLNISNNCVYNSNGSTPRGTRQPQDLWNQDPLFNDLGASDYHLKRGSPCIDAAATLAGLTNDFDGLPRPSGRAYDIGAFEFQDQETPLKTPSLSSPLNGALGQPTIIRLSWKDPNINPSEEGYRLRIRPRGGNYTYYDSVRDSMSILMTGLAVNTLHFWNVMALGDNHETINSPWSNSGKDRQFTTSSKASLLPPILSGPAIGSPGQSTSLVLQWQDTNSDPQEARYEVRIKPAGGVYSHYFAGTNSVEFPVGRLRKNTTYSWNVRARGDRSTTMNSSWANSGSDWRFLTGG